VISGDGAGDQTDSSRYVYSTIEHHNDIATATNSAAN
jgi:hypothetical protein